ncbi:MAG: UDP-glucose 4-epimerase [Sediminicola sp.]
MKSKVAITGYSGFVGSELCESLKAREIVCIGRKKPAFECDYIYSNFESMEPLSDSLKEVEVVIHCAARVHIINDASSDEDKLMQFRKINRDFTVHFAKQAALAKVKRFIFISSIKVNGEETNGDNAFRANDPIAAADPYGISKAEAEVELFKLGKDTGMEIVVLRPPLVYGKGVKANFSALASLVAKGYPLPLAALSKNQRSLVSVYNLVDLIKVCMNHERAAGNVFLVSDDNDISTYALVKLMATALNKKERLFYVPVSFFNFAGKLLGKQEQVSRLTGSLKIDISKTKKVLDWTPPVSLKTGFAKALKGSFND